MLALAARTLALFASLALAAPTAAQCPRDGFLPSTPGDDDHFGQAVDADSGRVAVGAPGDDQVVEDGGAVYVFDLATGALVHKLFPADPGSFKRFGAAVALDGDRLLVGDPESDDPSATGAAYLFDVVTGAQLAKYTASDARPFAQYGASVDLEDGHALIGAFGDDNVAPSAGAAYLVDVATGQELHVLRAPTPAALDRFGFAVALDGDDVLVAAPYHDDEADNSGVVFVHDRTTGALTGQLEHDAPVWDDNFGLFLAADGGRAAVSASFTDLHVFDLATGARTGQFATTLSGYCLDLEGPRLLAGNPYRAGAGAVLLLDVSTNQVLDEVTPPWDQANLRFGCGVALSGETFVVGAPGHDSGTNEDAGKVFRYAFCSDLGSTYCSPAVENSSGFAAEMRVVGSDVASANDVTLLAELLPANQFGYFLTSAIQGFVANPGGSQGNLCLGGTIGRFSQQVQDSGWARRFVVTIDLTSLPFSPPHAVMAGETWNFQAWFRDVDPTPTSNFTDAVSVTFQ